MNLKGKQDKMCDKPLCRVETFDGRVTIEGTKTADHYQKLKIEDPELYKKMLLRYKRIDIIPCGKCIGCRLAYSREWANRLMLEKKTTDDKNQDSYFLTITYSDEYVPIKEYVDENGELRESLTLEPKDIKKFFHNLQQNYERKYNHIGIRYFIAGEYGSTTQRPHYHAIVFNLPIHDLEIYKRDKGYTYYTSDEINKCWTKNGKNKGYIVIGEVEWDTAAYVARYILKKQKGQNAKEYYSMIGKIPEFTRMSRKPGIGREYFEKNKNEIYKNDEIILPKKDKIIHAKPPKYYDKLFDITDADIMELTKKQREKAQRISNSNILAAGKELGEQRDLKTKIRDAKIKSLQRNTI